MTRSSLPEIRWCINSNSASGTLSSSPAMTSVGTLIVARVGIESGRSAMPRCTAAMSAGDIFLAMVRAAVHNVWTVHGCRLREQLGQQFVDEPGGAITQDILGGLQPGRSALGGLRPGAGVRQYQRPYPLAVASPGFKQRIPADGNAHEDRARDFELAAQPVKVVGQFLHRDRTVTGLGVAVRPQIGQQDAIARGKLLQHAVPEMVMQRKRMQQHHIRARAGDLVHQLCVTAAKVRHGSRKSFTTGNTEGTENSYFCQLNRSVVSVPPW